MSTLVGTTSPQTLDEAVRLLDGYTDAGLVLDDGVDRIRYSWQEVSWRSKQIASWLLDGAPRPDASSVAILGGTTISTVTAVLGCVVAGRPVTLLPQFFSEKSLPSIARRLDLAHASQILVDPGGASARSGLERAGYASIHEIREQVDVDAELPAALSHPDDVAVIQFTSGTTGDPSPLRISHRQIVENLRAVRERTQFEGCGERLVSWLPLFHDMGLVGFLFQAVLTKSTLVLSDPAVFLRSPLRWAENICEFGGTLSAGPSFAYARLARALVDGPRDLDLGTWRLAFNGGENVRPDVCAKFGQEARRFGFRSEAIYPAYGLAEATLAVTLPEPGSGAAVDVVSGSALRAGMASPCHESADDAQQFCLLGSALRGINVTIVGADDRALTLERTLGEVIVTGPSVVDGLATSPGTGPNSCATGDLGYLRDGQLVICGRLKETINVGGHTILPAEIELVVERLPGVGQGRVIAVSLPGRHADEIAVVAEGEVNPQLVRTAVRDAMGVTPRLVKIVESGVLPRTTSGKLQRSLCRAQLISGSFDR